LTSDYSRNSGTSEPFASVAGIAGMRPRFVEYPVDDDEGQMSVSFHSYFHYLLSITGET
jgi:hypothetical protein